MPSAQRYIFIFWRGVTQARKHITKTKGILHMSKKQSEDKLQIEFVNWMHINHPVSWGKIHHSPNGGKRHPAEALRFKLMGVKAGFPDLAYFERRGKYSGLAIELKSENGKLSKSQIERLEILSNDGWVCFVCFDLKSTIEIFEDYISLAGKIDYQNYIWIIKDGQRVARL